MIQCALAVLSFLAGFNLCSDAWLAGIYVALLGIAFTVFYHRQVFSSGYPLPRAIKELRAFDYALLGLYTLLGVFFVV